VNIFKFFLYITLPIIITVIIVYEDNIIEYIVKHHLQKVPLIIEELNPGVDRELLEKNAEIAVREIITCRFV
jgi:hypothetical protein